MQYHVIRIRRSPFGHPDGCSLCRSTCIITKGSWRDLPRSGILNLSLTRLQTDGILGKPGFVDPRRTRADTESIVTDSRCQQNQRKKNRRLICTAHWIYLLGGVLQLRVSHHIITTYNNFPACAANSVKKEMCTPLDSALFALCSLPSCWLRSEARTLSPRAT
jgi:hypothetical protein